MSGEQTEVVPSNQDTNRDKVLRLEIVKVSDGRLREMQAQAISFEGVGDWEYHWHWAAIVNELIARRAVETTDVLPKQWWIDRLKQQEAITDRFVALLKEARSYMRHDRKCWGSTHEDDCNCGFVQIAEKLAVLQMPSVEPTTNQDGQQTPAPSGHAGLGTTGQSPSAVRSSENGSETTKVTK